MSKSDAQQVMHSFGLTEILADTLVWVLDTIKSIFLKAVTQTLMVHLMAHFSRPVSASVLLTKAGTGMG